MDGASSATVARRSMKSFATPRTKKPLLVRSARPPRWPKLRPRRRRTPRRSRRTMAVFTYTALDRTGRTLNGTIPAESRTEAMDHVIGKGLSPLAIEEQRNGKAREEGDGAHRAPPTRVPQSAVESFTRELANLLSAGLPLARALHLLRREASNAAAKYVWGKIHDDVVGGIPLGDALAKWPKAFSTVYVAMVR